jgi:hypothetical protein
MKDFPAFFLLIKTNFDKYIATFVYSKFECTNDIEYEYEGQKWKGKEAVN